MIFLAFFLVFVKQHREIDCELFELSELFANHLIFLSFLNMRATSNRYFCINMVTELDMTVEISSFK